MIYILIFILSWQIYELHDLYQLPVYSENEYDINVKQMNYLKIEIVIIFVMAVIIQIYNG